MQFFTVYFSKMKQEFFSNIVFWSIIAVLYLAVPFSFSFLNWYGSSVQGNIVSKDPIAYPHKYKQKTYYNYYANIYFPEENVTKRTSISEQTFYHGLQGQAYIFKRNHVLQSGKRNTLMFASIINISICGVIFFAFIIHFFCFLNSYFSTKNEE